MSSRANSSGWQTGVFLATLTLSSLWAEQAPAPSSPQEGSPPAASPDPDPALPPPANPYLAIPIRNAFGLLPPPPPPSDDNIAPPPPPPPPITVRLTGVTDLLGKKMAMFVFIEQGSAKAIPTFVTLKEGERNNGVEVLAINVANNSVRLSNHGQLTNVSFAKMESSPGPAAPIPGMPSGAPGYPPRIPGMSPPNMGGNPNANLAPQPVANSTTIVGGGNDANGSVIIGGLSDAGPRLGSKGSINSVGGAGSAPSYGGNSSPIYSTPGGGIINSGSPTDTPSRPQRTSVPRYKIPVPPDLPIPGGGSTTPQQ